ncbi:MAG: hypothetical protein NDJ90_04040 [Oligoflexia bacterium]|nr:hypothetical protein [Oligoflexia bacterium]
MIGLTVLLVKVNTAIQMAIVNQQYGRAQALFLTTQSPVYPRLGLRADLEKFQYNQMLMGVSENAPGAERSNPRASVAKITNKAGGSVATGTDDVTERSDVRIRNTVTLCTQINVVDVGGSKKPVLPLDAKWQPTGNWNIHQKTAFDYCSSPLRYL